MSLWEIIIFKLPPGKNAYTSKIVNKFIGGITIQNGIIGRKKHGKKSEHSNVMLKIKKYCIAIENIAIESIN